MITHIIAENGGFTSRSFAVGGGGGGGGGGVGGGGGGGWGGVGGWGVGGGGRGWLKLLRVRQASYSDVSPEVLGGEQLSVSSSSVRRRNSNVFPCLDPWCCGRPLWGHWRKAIPTSHIPLKKPRTCGPAGRPPVFQLIVVVPVSLPAGTGFGRCRYSSRRMPRDASGAIASGL